MDIYVIVLRLVHIFAGVAWVGAGLLVMNVVEPFARTAGPEGERFLQRLIGQSKYSQYMGIVGGLNTLSGILLYWRESGGLQPIWIMTAAGIVLTIGGLAGISAFLVGPLVHAPTGARLAAIGKEIEASGKPPSPVQLAELQSLQNKIAGANKLSAVLLIILVAGMAIAREV